MPFYLQETKLAKTQKIAKIKSEKTRIHITRSETREKQNNESYPRFTNIKCQLHKISTRNTKHGRSTESEIRKKWKVQKRTEKNLLLIKKTCMESKKNTEISKKTAYLL